MPGDYQDQFSTDAVKGLEPTTTGTSLRITYGSESGACDDSPAVVDGVAQGNASHATYSVVQHRGYLVAEETGNYTLNVAGSDLVAAWFGQYAVSGWDWSNAAVVAQSASEDDNGGLDGWQSYSFNATQVGSLPPFFRSCACEDLYRRRGQTLTFVGNGKQGDYIPMRIMYVNAQGCSALGVNLTRPDGMEILGADDIRSQNVIRDCIGGDPRFPNMALPFVPWAQES